MISLEALAYIERLLATRGIEDPYTDVFTMVLNPKKTQFYSPANRGFLFLLTHNLPLGTSIASETNILQIDAQWQNRGITKIQEFSGQIAVQLTAPGSLNQVEFLRAIPR